MSIVYDPLYNSFSERKVFKCRITVHTLGRQVEDEQSENHVVINLLIGNRQSVRVDMTVRNLENEGSLVLKLYNYTTSTSAIKAVDISTRGCPTHFNPDAPILNVEHGLTVQDFVSTIVDSDYHMFRFLVLGEASLGCRYWV